MTHVHIDTQRTEKRNQLELSRSKVLMIFFVVISQPRDHHYSLVKASMGLFYFIFYIIAENKLYGKQKFMILMHFV